MNYHSKYLKYKSKYLKLKNQLGGAILYSNTDNGKSFNSKLHYGGDISEFEKLPVDIILETIDVSCDNLFALRETSKYLKDIIDNNIVYLYKKIRKTEPRLPNYETTSDYDKFFSKILTRPKYDPFFIKPITETITIAGTIEEPPKTIDNPYFIPDEYMLINKNDPDYNKLWVIQKKDEEEMNHMRNRKKKELLLKHNFKLYYDACNDIMIRNIVNANIPGLELEAAKINSNVLNRYHKLVNYGFSNKTLFEAINQKEPIQDSYIERLRVIDNPNSEEDEVEAAKISTIVLNRYRKLREHNIYNSSALTIAKNTDSISDSCIDRIIENINDGINTDNLPIYREKALLACAVGFDLITNIESQYKHHPNKKIVHNTKMSCNGAIRAINELTDTEFENMRCLIASYFIKEDIAIICAKMNPELFNKLKEQLKRYKKLFKNDFLYGYKNYKEYMDDAIIMNIIKDISLEHFNLIQAQQI